MLSRLLDKAGSELGVRLLSATVLATVSIATAMLGGWWFAGWVLALALAVAYEWFALTGSAGRWAAMAAVVAAWFAMVWQDVMILALYVFGADTVELRDVGQGGMILALYVTAMGAAGTATVTVMRKGNDGGLWGAAGAVYATVPLVVLLWMRDVEGGGYAILWLFFVVWATDTGAFVLGRAVGGARLAPRLSGEKTWAGAAGGFAAGTLAGVVFHTFIQADAPRAAALAAIVSLAAQFGDLLQSAVKRKFGAKDTGTLVPGHGGVMDRLDSLVVATPVLALVVSLVALVSGGVNG